MNPSLKPGLAIKAKPTHTNQTCGIDTVAARGYICKADESGVSVYLQQSTNKGWIEAVMSPETFAWNFEEDHHRGDNIAYRILTHFSGRYPEDYEA